MTSLPPHPHPPMKEIGQRAKITHASQTKKQNVKQKWACYTEWSKSEKNNYHILMHLYGMQKKGADAGQE